jgi:ABC-type branched-subunit amino acid transport system ATPase component
MYLQINGIVPYCVNLTCRSHSAGEVHTQRTNLVLFRICSHPTSNSASNSSKLIHKDLLRETEEITQWSRNALILACCRVFQADAAGQLSRYDTPLPEIPAPTNDNTVRTAADARGVTTVNAAKDAADKAADKAHIEEEYYKTSHSLAAAAKKLLDLAEAVQEAITLKQSRCMP